MHSDYKKQIQANFISQAEMFEKDLSIMDVYCRQLMQNDLFRNLSTTKDSTINYIAQGDRLQTTLATDVYPESLLPISEVFIYYPDTGYVASQNYFITGDRFYHWIQKYQDKSYDMWLEMLSNESTYYQFLPLTAFQRTHNSPKYIYIYNANDINYMDIHAIVCFIFDQDELFSLFSGVTSGADAYLLVQDDSGHQILSLTEQLEDSPSINTEYETARTSKQLGIYTSAQTKYTYTYRIPEFQDAAVNIKQVSYIVFTIVFLFLGAFVIYHLSKRNVEPILRLNQELNKSVELQNYLQDMVDHQRPIICNSYVRRLLMGSVTHEESEYIRDYLRIEDTSLSFNSLYLCYYNNSLDVATDAEENLRTPEEVNQMILSSLEQFLGQSVRYFSPADRTFALLLTCPKEEEKEFIFKTHNMIVQLHNHLLDTYGIWLFAGIGKNTDDLLNVWECYQQAVEAVSFTSKSYFYFPYEFTKKDSNTFYYPPEISTKLIHFITTGNSDQVVELFSLIHQENMEERSLSIHLLKFLLSDIKNTLLKARFALPAQIPEATIQSIDDKLNETASFKLCEDIALDLCKLFTSNEKEDDLIDVIEKYLTDNYADPSLGLNKIADEFDISESYFSHLFKEKKGVNFSTYLEKLRMEQAVRLIKETSISLNELYISVGYNNANTFRRVFKKTYGITPSAMRDNPGISDLS